jgi:endo-1,4-beta-D-glucanase Y
MVIAYFQGDEDAFRRLQKYNQYHWVETRGSYLMDWKFRSFVYGPLGDGKGSATDADLDIATALVLGSEKWGDTQMLEAAQGIMKDIWDWEINPDNLLIRPGNTTMWATDGADNFNPSYFSPVAFRIFAKYDNDASHRWLDALDANYNWLTKISDGGYLVPDWTNSEGVPTLPANKSGPDSYYKYYLESVRVPWRLAWDYGWFGEARAKAILDNMAGEIKDLTGSDPSQITGSYDYETGAGSAAGAAAMAFQASLCAVGMANAENQGWLDACAPTVNGTAISGFKYFPHILQVMYAQILNGVYGAYPLSK